MKFEKFQNEFDLGMALHYDPPLLVLTCKELTIPIPREVLSMMIALQMQIDNGDFRGKPVAQKIAPLPAQDKGAANI